MFGVPFPHYEILAEIYGKDRATGAASESFVQAVHNIDEDMARGSFALDSDDDFNIGEEVEAESESLQSASGSRKRKDPSSERSDKRIKIRSKKGDDVVDLASSRSEERRVGKECRL